MLGDVSVGGDAAGRDLGDDPVHALEEVVLFGRSVVTHGCG